jgi:hypothetical protein
MLLFFQILLCIIFGIPCLLAMIAIMLFITLASLRMIIEMLGL